MGRRSEWVPAPYWRTSSAGVTTLQGRKGNLSSRRDYAVTPVVRLSTHPDSSKRKPGERVRTIAELARGPRVLHVGACDNVKPKEETMGDFAHKALVDAGFSVLATDINRIGLEWLAGMGYETEYLDAENIPTDGELFDCIVAGELIEHLSNPGRFLEGCASRLKPGESLVLSTPQPFCLLYTLEYTFKRRTTFNREHTCWFDRQTLEQLLARYGFSIEQLRFVDDLLIAQRSTRFGVFARAWLGTRWLFPPRFRTTIVVHARQNGNTHRGDEEYLQTW